MEKELNQLEDPQELTPKERTLEDTLLGSISKKPTVEVLKEKVVHLKEHPAPPGESDIDEGENTILERKEDDVFDEKLYHLNTKRITFISPQEKSTSTISTRGSPRRLEDCNM